MHTTSSARGAGAAVTPTSAASAPSGPAIDAVVKWFAPDKGFGFVELADGSGDAFLHVVVLQAAGHEAVDPETKLSVQVGQGQKGRQVTARPTRWTVFLPMSTPIVATGFDEF